MIYYHDNDGTYTVELTKEELQIITVFLGKGSPAVMVKTGIDTDLHHKLFNSLADICDENDINYSNNKFWIVGDNE